MKKINTCEGASYLWGYKLYFDVRPKDRIEDLYDREREIESLIRAMEKKAPLITVLGLRRTGKTSVLLTGLNEAKLPYVIIDARKLEVLPFANFRELVEILENSMNDFMGRYATLRDSIKEFITKITGVEFISAFKVSFKFSGKERLSLPSFFDALNDWAKSRGSKLIIAIDEAQEIRKVKGLRLDYLLAHIYDYKRNISTILTGSQMGLLYDFIGVENAEAPLYGRAREEIILKYFTEEQSQDFLIKGFKQARIKFSSEIIDDAVKVLNGNPGWLTMFGSLSLKKEPSKRVLQEVVNVGKKMVKSELKNFLQTREIAKNRYLTILKTLVHESAPWSKVKAYVEMKEGRKINDSNFFKLVNNLEKVGFVEKSPENLYKLTDPILAIALKK